MEAESQVASGGMAGPGDEESELGLVATRGEDESDSENGASFVVRTGLQDQRKDALLQSLRHLKADLQFGTPTAAGSIRHSTTRRLIFGVLSSSSQC